MPPTVMLRRTLAGCVTLLALPAAASAHEEIVIGRSASGQLIAHVDFPQPALIPPSVFPGITGWAYAIPGFSTITEDEPDEGLYVLSTAASIRFVLVSADPGIQVWNDGGSAPMQPGQTFPLGQPPFDVHPLWNITTGSPGEAFSVTLRLHDDAGLYADSEPFTVSLTPSRITVGCRADSDHDFVITPADVATFVNSWIFSLNVGILQADYDGNGRVEPADIAGFVNDWFFALSHDC